ncbi:MAG: hypothetical protein ABJA64_03035 [Candidatus Saccharibacteria bacterium]
MSQLIDVIKRDGKRPSESFIVDKLHDSVYAACLSVHTPDGEAVKIAEKVCAAVLAWCTEKPEVTSNDLRRVASGHLLKFHPEAAYLYKHHRLII